MEELYRNLSNVIDLWGDHESSNQQSFQATEIWLKRDPGSTVLRARDIPVTAPDLERWLDTTTRGSGDDAETLVARFACLGVDTKQKARVINLADSVLERLVSGLGLELAFKYARTLITGITALPPVTRPGAVHRPYSLSYAPKLSAIWSHTSFEGTSSHETITSGIFFVDQGYLPPLKMAILGSKLKSPAVDTCMWPLELCRQAMFPAFCVALSFSGQIIEEEEHVKKSLRTIEYITGYHSFARGLRGFKHVYKRASPEELELSNQDANTLETFSKEANAHATKLASVSRKLKAMETMLSFMRKSVENDANQHSQPAILTSTDGGDVLKSYLDVMQERLAMQVLDTEYTLTRVQVQIEALFHLVAAADTRSNLELAKSTHRDASSMKTLAVVTMFFLPGSFVSALFSTNFFDWDSVDLTSRTMSVATTPQFALYWAITIPLTVVTFMLYFTWLWFQKRERAGTLPRISAGKKIKTYELELERKSTTAVERQASTMSSVAKPVRPHTL